MQLFLRVHLRGLWESRSRGLFAVAGVALGVTVVVGVTMLNAQVGRPFEKSRVGRARQNVWQVTPVVQGRLPESFFRRLEGVAGRARSVPVTAELTPMIGPRGRTAGVLLLGTDCRIEAVVGGFDCASRVAGRMVSGPGVPLAVSRRAAEALGASAGSSVALPGGLAGEAHVGRIFDDAALRDLNNGFLAVADVPAVQSLLGRQGFLSEAYVVGAGGVTRMGLERAMDGVALVSAPRSRLPAFLQLARQFLGLVSVLAFLVGVLIALNAVGLALEERRVAIGTLGALGASNSRLLVGFLGEGAVLGLIGGLVALPGGYLFGGFLLEGFGTTLLRGTGAEVSPGFEISLVLVGIAAGVLAGLLAAFPAAVGVLRAGPLASMGDVAGRTRQRPPLRWPAPVGLALIAVGVLTAPAFGKGRVPLAVGYVGVGLAVTGFVLVLTWVAPRATNALAYGAGYVRPAESCLSIADLARLPNRTAFTVAVLSMGATVAVAVFSLQSITNDTFTTLRRRMFADTVIVSGQRVGDQREGYVSDALLERVRQVNEGGAVTPRYRAIIPSPTEPRLVMAFPVGSAYARDYVRVVGPERRAWSRIARGQVGLSTLAAGRLGARPGSRVRLPTVLGPRDFSVATVFEPRFGDDTGIGEWILVSPEVGRRFWGTVRTDLSATPAPGRGPAALASRLRVLRTAEVADLSRQVADSRESVARYLGPFNLLAFALLAVAGAAVLNMLFLGLVQRRRERAVFRALGMTTELERRVILVETACMAALAALAAAGGALLFSWLLVAASPVFFGVSLRWEPVGSALATGALAALLVAFLGALWPVAYAGRFSAEALRAE